MSDKELLQLQQKLATLQKEGKLMLSNENKEMLANMNALKKKLESKLVQTKKEHSVPFLETSGI